MYAKNLERILFQLSRKSDLSKCSSVEFADRFEALRGSNQLPRGRENRDKVLTNEQIAAAIFGLVPANPNWAGFAAIALSNLRPVGGRTELFLQSNTLLQSISRLINDYTAREHLICLTVSLAESATNSHGFASLLFEAEGNRHQDNFAHRIGNLATKPGTENGFDQGKYYSEVSKSITFSRAFFDKIGEEIENARRSSSEPEGIGSEYDEAEARDARYRKLGVQANSNFLNVGVDNQVTWPKDEVLVTFDGYKLVLMPKTQDKVQSIHIDLFANRLSNAEALTVINRFLSIMTWCNDQYAVMQDGWSGNSVPVAVPRRDLAFSIAYTWVFDRKLPDSQEARRALALYRDARNAQQNFMVSYSVLNYFKILEIGHRTGKERGKWLREAFALIQDDTKNSELLEVFLGHCGDHAPEKYIYRECRGAVAHAGSNDTSDPDEGNEIQRLHITADVMRLLARHFIKTELQISESMFSGD